MSSFQRSSMKATNSVNSIPCKCATTFNADCVFQSPCSVVEICKEFWLHWPQEQSCPQIQAWLAKQYLPTQMYIYELFNVICRCTVEIFKCSWLIAKEALVIFKFKVTIEPWLECVCTDDVPNFSLIFLFLLDDMSCASQHDVSSTLLHYHRHHQVVWCQHQLACNPAHWS